MNAPADLPPIERERIHGSAELPLALIKPNPWNRKLDEKKLHELADTVKKHGVMQPILVRPAAGAKAGAALYEIVAGERRWRASQIAGLATIPALVKQLTDLEVIELMLVENLEREGLHELDEAEGYDRLLRKEGGLQGFETVDALCARFGKSRSYVFQRLKLLKLCPEAKAAFRDGKIDFGHARAIAPIADPARQAACVKEVLQGWGGDRMSVRDTLVHVQRKYMLELDRAIFKITDATLLPEAGSCRECPKRTGSNPDLFEGISKHDTCTDPACYQRKEEAHRAALKAKAEAQGREVITGTEAKKVKPQSHSSLKGYLELDATHYSLGSKPLRKLLGKKLPEVKLLEDPHTKALVEVVAEAEALALLKESGVLKQARMPSTGATERENERKAKQETAWRRAVAAECVEQARSQAGAEAAYRAELLHLVAITLWHRLDSDQVKRVEGLLAWEHISGTYEPANRKRVDDRIRALSDGELCRYFTACVLAREIHVGSYNLKDKAATLLAVAGQLHVDAAAMREEMRREQLQRVPGKKAAKAKGQPAMTPETALAAAVKAAKPLKTSKVAVRYRDPATGATWTGRGLQPAWLKAALASGKTLADFDTKAVAPKAVLSDAAADVMGQLAGSGS